MSTPRVIVVGSINTDLVIRSATLPRPGETMLGGEFFQAPGGKGANQAVAAARAAREPVAFVAAVGSDNLGLLTLTEFEKENLGTRFIRVVPGAATGVALILVDSAGQNMISVASGANLALAPADIDALPDELFAGARVLLASLESPLATVVRAIERAKSHGLMTIVNPAPADARIASPELLRRIDVLTPNCGEAAALCGLPAPADDDPQLAERAARTLHERGCASVIVTLGRLGAVAFDGSLHQIAPVAGVKAIDATAAGDAFNGALAVALGEEAGQQQAAEFATRAAAISVTRPGAQPSLPTRAEIDAFRP